MIRQKLAIMPKLHNCKGDLSKDWFVYYSFLDPKTNKMKRFKDYTGFRELTTVAERKLLFRKKKDKLRNKIKYGWNPFEEEEKKVLYKDTLEYYLNEKKYGSFKKTVKSWNYHLSLWLEEKKSSIRKKTFKTYQSKFRVFCAWLKTKKVDDVDIRAFDREEAVSFIRYLDEERKLSNKMKNMYIIILKQACSDFVDQNKLFVNPFEKLKKYKKETKTPVMLTDDILKRIKEYLVNNDSQLWVICQFIFYCFIRPGELRFLKIKHIDFIRNTVTVPAEVSKNHKAQPVIIPDHFVDQLKLKNYHKRDPEFYVFTIDQEPGIKHCSENYMSERFRRLRVRLDIPKEFKFYSFKHTGGYKLWKSGADVIEMKNQYRHHSLDQMMEYLKALDGEDSEHIRKKGYIL